MKNAGGSLCPLSFSGGPSRSDRRVDSDLKLSAVPCCLVIRMFWRVLFGLTVACISVANLVLTVRGWNVVRFPDMMIR